MKSKAAPGTEAKAPSPVKNTYFWIAAILALLGIYGLIRGDATIRDPGQRPEVRLWLWFLGASVLMFVNGWLSHRLTLQSHAEERTNEEEKSDGSM